MGRVITLLAAIVHALGAYRPVPPRPNTFAPYQLWERELCASTRYLPDAERMRCFQALQVAARVHDGQKRRDGQPFVTHPVAVASLVANWGMDGQCVVAALLHDAVEDTPLTFGEVEAVFGPEVRSLVQGVTRLSKLDAAKIEEIHDLECSSSSGGGGGGDDAPSVVSSSGDASAKAPSGSGASPDLLQLLHACAGDWRVAVLKVADRLHNMRTLAAMKPHKRARKALETERVFVPLAHYLGAHDVGTELAQLAAKHRNSDQPQHRVWVARLASTIAAAAPQQRVSAALLSMHAALRLPAPASTIQAGGLIKPLPELPRSSACERNFRKIVLQLAESDPHSPGLSLVHSLRPLHERLARHRVVMRHSIWGDELEEGSGGGDEGTIRATPSKTYLLSRRVVQPSDIA